MTTFDDMLKNEFEEAYGIPSDAYIKYQMDNMDRVEHTNEDEMDENKRVELEEMIATKLLEVVSQDDLENTYYEMQKEWTETLPDEELLQTAKDLGIEI